MFATAVGLFAQPTIRVTTSTGSSTVTTVTTPAPKVPLANKNWEGINSTDYFRFAPPNQLAPPNPEIAVGPEDILTVVDRVLTWYPNPNSPLADYTKAPLNAVPNIPFNQLQLVLLDVWLGDLLTNSTLNLCPTMPRTPASCIVSNATVRYDQMQGRFLVAATVVDTGFVSGQAFPAGNRKASWILVVSRFANLTTGAAGTTVPFTKPNPPDTQAGGIDTGNWKAYVGNINDVDQTGFTANTYSATVPNPNFGLIVPPAIVPDPNPTIQVSATTAIDCTVPAYGAAFAPTTGAASVCYMPTSLRIGIENNNVALISSVINDNIALAARGSANAAYAGSRLRVFKKSSIYPWAKATTQPVAITKGSIFTPTKGDFYDIYPATSASPYIWSIDPDVAGLFYEPIHLRGRAIASFSGTIAASCTAPFDISPSKCDDSISYIVGAQSSRAAGMPQTNLKWRSLVYNATTGIPSLSALGTTASVPVFADPGCVVQGAYADGLTKGNAAPYTASPCLYVGDDRPQRVMFREGFLYVARVGDRSVSGITPTDFMQGSLETNGGTSGLGNVTGAGLTSTVIYDVFQKLAPQATPNAIIQAQWENGRYWAPMYDTPANVQQSGSINPINLLPFLEKLFVSTTYKATFPFDQPGTKDAFAGLYDIKNGLDVYDTGQTLIDPFTGASIACNPTVVPTIPQTAGCASASGTALVPFGIRGSAATDPNNGSLWNYGSYARGRESSVPGPGQWGTYVANYNLSFQALDPYGNSTAYYTDVPATHPQFLWIQIARQLGLPSATDAAATSFGPDTLVTRAEMAAWVVRSQMDDAAITAYLAATGGATQASFADVQPADKFFKEIEVMSRRGYTKGCGLTNDGRRKYCPTDNLTRGQMAVFLIRAKENNVFPTILSGCPQAGGSTCGPTGDQFGNFQPLGSVFTDVSTDNDFSSYIQKMNELGIARGYSVGGAYGVDDPITRSQIAVFVVRAFFL